MTWWIKFALLIFLTVAITSLVLWLRSWIEKNKQKHPEIYKQRSLISFAIWLTLNTGDLQH